VLIAGRALGLDSDAVLDLLDLEAADAALAAARLDAETGAAQGPERAAHPAEHAAAVLLVGLVRRRPMARGNGPVALLAVAQLLALNGLRVDLDPEGTTDLLTEVAAGRMGASEVRGWIVASLCPPEAARGKQARLRRAVWEPRRERERRPPDPFVRFTPPARNAVVLAPRGGSRAGPRPHRHRAPAPRSAWPARGAGRQGADVAWRDGGGRARRDRAHRGSRPSPA